MSLEHPMDFDSLLNHQNGQYCENQLVAEIDWDALPFSFAVPEAQLKTDRLEKQEERPPLLLSQLNCPRPKSNIESMILDPLSPIFNAQYCKEPSESRPGPQPTPNFLNSLMDLNIVPETPRSDRMEDQFSNNWYNPLPESQVRSPQLLTPSPSPRPQHFVDSRPLLDFQFDWEIDLLKRLNAPVPDPSETNPNAVEANWDFSFVFNYHAQVMKDLKKKEKKKRSTKEKKVPKTVKGRSEDSAHRGPDQQPLQQDVENKKVAEYEENPESEIFASHAF